MGSQTEDQPHVKSVLVSWSGGKDSRLALHEIQRSSNMRVEAS